MSVYSDEASSDAIQHQDTQKYEDTTPEKKKEQPQVNPKKKMNQSPTAKMHPKENARTKNFKIQRRKK